MHGLSDRNGIAGTVWLAPQEDEEGTGFDPHSPSPLPTCDSTATSSSPSKNSMSASPMDTAPLRHRHHRRATPGPQDRHTTTLAYRSVHHRRRIDAAMDIGPARFDVVIGEVKTARLPSTLPSEPQVLHAALRRPGDLYTDPHDEVVDGVIANGGAITPCSGSARGLRRPRTHRSEQPPPGRCRSLSAHLAIP
jgi:hypothetical protein